MTDNEGGSEVEQIMLIGKDGTETIIFPTPGKTVEDVIRKLHLDNIDPQTVRITLKDHKIRAAFINIACGK